jgi:hypothetical protein
MAIRRTREQPANKWLERLKAGEMSVLPEGQSTTFSSTTYLPELLGTPSDENQVPIHEGRTVKTDKSQTEDGNEENQPSRASVVTDKTDESQYRAIAMLDLAQASNWRISVIIGGGIDHHLGQLILGEVVGGDEAHWRAFAARALPHQLLEATHLLAWREVAI